MRDRMKCLRWRRRRVAPAVAMALAGAGRRFADHGGLTAYFASCPPASRQAIQFGSPLHGGVMPVKLAGRTHNVFSPGTRCFATPSDAEVGR